MPARHSASRWCAVVATAAERYGTPCYVAAWDTVQQSLMRLETTSGPIPVRSWLSFKTEPLPPLARRWLQTGRGIEVVSEYELVTAIRLGCPVDQLLVNGVAKHAWLPRHPLRYLRVHFDSLREIEVLLPMAVRHQWRVGIRCHAPDERDRRDAQFGGQFGLNRTEGVSALRELRQAGADLQSVHFHLGQCPHRRDAHARAIEHVASICDDAGVEPRFLDCGGGLPSPYDADADEKVEALASALRQAPAHFRAVEEIWLENGRYVTDRSAALAVRVLDVKERPDARYLICDGGRTNQALAADRGPHPLLILPDRRGALRLTTVCGPTCMTDDILGRFNLPDNVGPGDVLVWLNAGAYHLAWETRFSQGLCAVIWCDEDGHLSVARSRETPEQWAGVWTQGAA